MLVSPFSRLKSTNVDPFVVALGACAHLGGVNAIRNRQPVDKVTHYVYGDSPAVRDDLLRVTPLGARHTLEELHDEHRRALDRSSAGLRRRAASALIGFFTEARTCASSAFPGGAGR